MLDIVKMKPVIDIHDLVEAMGEIEGIERSDIYSELHDMHPYGGCNKSYLEIDVGYVADWMYKPASKCLGKDYKNISDEELLSYSNPNTPDEKVMHRLFEMMVKEEIPQEFILLIWW